MLSCGCVKRLLSVLANRPDRKLRTAVYVSKTGDIDGLGPYVRRYLEDESYISRGGYVFDFEEDNVFIETTNDYKFFKSVIARDYEIIFMIEGDESDQLTEIINSLSDENNMIFVPIDCRLRSYKYLNERTQRRVLKRKASI